MLKIFREWRIFTLSCLVFMGYMSLVITDWFMGLDNPTNSQGAFASAIVLASVGAIKFYMETKHNNNSDSNR